MERMVSADKQIMKEVERLSYNCKKKEMNLHFGSIVNKSSSLMKNTLVSVLIEGIKQ